MQKIQPIQKNLWWVQAELIIITTNSTLDKNNCLVMGAGLALQAKTRIPYLPKKAGESIISLFGDKKHPEYLLLIYAMASQKIGLLQTKTDWRKPSDKGLIKRSLQKLKGTIIEQNIQSIAMPLPGSGYGGLLKAESLKLVNEVLEEVSNRIILCDI